MTQSTKKKAVFGSRGWGEGMTGGRDQVSLEVEPCPKYRGRACGYDSEERLTARHRCVLT